MQLSGRLRRRLCRRRHLANLHISLFHNRYRPGLRDLLRLGLSLRHDLHINRNQSALRMRKPPKRSVRKVYNPSIANQIPRWPAICNRNHHASRGWAAFSKSDTNFCAEWIEPRGRSQVVRVETLAVGHGSATMVLAIPGRHTLCWRRIRGPSATQAKLRRKKQQRDFSGHAFGVLTVLCSSPCRAKRRTNG